MAPRPLRFLTLEGISGAGKSTLVPRLADRLEARGHTVARTRDPGGTGAGRAIRELLLHANGALCPETELALFFADRAQNLAEVIRPALERGEFVIGDRFTDSTLAYQCCGRGLPIRRALALDEAITGRFRPDLTVLLDLPVSIALARLNGRDRIEQEKERFHERVRHGFLRIAREEPERVVVVRADRPREEVFREVWGQVRRRLR